MDGYAGISSPLACKEQGHPVLQASRKEQCKLKYKHDEKTPKNISKRSERTSECIPEPTPACRLLELTVHSLRACAGRHCGHQRSQHTGTQLLRRGDQANVCRRGDPGPYWSRQGLPEMEQW